MHRIGNTLVKKRTDPNKTGIILPIIERKSATTRGVRELTASHAELKKSISSHVAETVVKNWFANEKIQKINAIQANAINKIFSNEYNRKLALRRIQQSLMHTNPEIKKARPIVAEEILNKILEINERGFVPVRVLDLIKIKIEKTKAKLENRKEAVA